MSRLSFLPPSEPSAGRLPPKGAAALWGLLACGLAALCGGAVLAAEEARKPNIVLIFADDKDYMPALLRALVPDLPRFAARFLCGRAIDTSNSWRQFRAIPRD